MLHRRYRFQPQDHGFDPGDEAFATGTGKVAGTIVSHRRRRPGSIELKRSRKLGMAAPRGAHGSRPALEAAPRSRRCCGSPTRSSPTASTATAPTARSGTCSCAYAPRRVGGLGRVPRRAGRGCPRCRTAARARARCGNAADPGAAGHRQDLCRSAHDPRPRRSRKAGRRDRAVPQDDQQHARSGRRGCDRRAGRRPDHPEGRLEMSARSRA